MFMCVVRCGRQPRAREAVTTMRITFTPQRLSTLLAARVPALPATVCVPAVGQAYVGGLPQARAFQPAWRTAEVKRGQQAQGMTISTPAFAAALKAAAFIGIKGKSTTSGTDNYIGTATTATGEGMATLLRDRMVLTVDPTIKAVHQLISEARGVPPRGRPV